MLRTSMRRGLPLFGALVLLPAIVVAQVPSLRTPVGVPTLPDTPVTGAVDTVERTAVDGLGALDSYRRDVEHLLRTDRTRVVRTPGGDAMLRGEYLALGAGNEARRDAQAAGFEISRQDPGDDLLPAMILLRDRRDRAPARALRALRAAMPGVDIEFHHLFLPAAQSAAQPVAQHAVRPTAAPAGAADADIRVGLIDGGVDAQAPPLSRVRITRHGCGGDVVPQAHGTRVAARLVSGSRGLLYAADLWCGQRVGGGTLGLIDALRWMAREQVPVVNISLVGPDDIALHRVVDAMIARGHVLVAAAGNDGPAAPPRFPAGYPAVVAVAAVDAKLRPLPESAAGTHIDLCASGIVDGTKDGRGTSFAAPLIAHALALRIVAAGLPAPATASADDAIRSLERTAIDNGRAGRDNRCGLGVIASP